MPLSGKCSRARAHVCVRVGEGGGSLLIPFCEVPLCITPAVFNAQEEKSFSGK